MGVASSDRQGAQLIVMKITDSGVENAWNRYRRNQNSAPQLGPAPPDVSVASFSRHSAVKGPGFWFKRVPPNPKEVGKPTALGLESGRGGL